MYSKDLDYNIHFSDTIATSSNTKKASKLPALAY